MKPLLNSNSGPDITTLIRSTISVFSPRFRFFKGSQSCSPSIKFDLRRTVAGCLSFSVGRETTGGNEQALAILGRFFTPKPQLPNFVVGFTWRLSAKNTLSTSKNLGMRSRGSPSR